MPYRRGNFSYVIDSSFTPFTLQEMLVPFAAYKDAYEKAEESYNELSTKAGDFKYLSKQLPEGSDARALYEGYANELQAQAEDLSRNGLTAMNRGALTSLKRRFSGEIGTLQKAEADLKELLKLRSAMDAQDSTGIYATETPTIDDLLPGKNFNRYRVSGKELYAAGAAASKAITARIFNTEEGEILQKAYLDFVQKRGMSPEDVEKFRNDMSTNPALQNAIEGIAQQYGIYENLKGAAQDRAKQNIINGAIDNVIMEITHTPQRNPEVPTWAEKASVQKAADDLTEKKREFDLTLRSNGYDEKGNYDPKLKGEYDKTKYGNPVYLDAHKRPFAYDLKTGEKRYDNDGDGVFTDTYYNPKKGGGSGGQDLDGDGVVDDNSPKPSPVAKDRAKQLASLDKTALGNDNGFSIALIGGKPEHYNYISLLYNQKGKDGKGDTYKAGFIGNDVIGPGWGFTSSSNVMDRMGNYSMSRIRDIKSKKKANESDKSGTVHVLSEQEWSRLPGIDPVAYNAITSRLISLGVEIGKDQFQVIEVPNESSNRKGYALAVSDEVYNKIIKTDKFKKVWNAESK